MGARKVLRAVGGVGLLLAAWAARAAEPAGDAEALRAKLHELRRKHSALTTKLREIEDKINASADLEPLRKARKEAFDAYQGKLKGDAALAAANKEHEAALRELNAIVREKLAASDEAKPIFKQIEWVEDALADVEYRQALAEFELMNRRSPVNRAIDKDPEIKALAKAVEDAYRAGARDRTEESKAALRKAEAAHAEARKAKLMASPDARRLNEQIAAAKTELEKLFKDRQEADTRLSEVRRKIEQGDDPAVKAAMEKLAAARKRVTEATSAPELKAAREAAEKAAAAASAKTRELMAADPAAVALAKERDALDKEMYELYRKLREARKQ